MRRLRLNSLAVLLICEGLFTSAPSRSDVIPQFLASDLFAMCTSTSNVDFGYCAGYLQAHADILLTQDLHSLRACNHVTVKSQQLVDNFNAYIDLFPESKNDAASLVATRALARAFPCLK